MEFWIGLLVVIVILGALAGGESFGDTISKGIGILLLLIIIGILTTLILSGS